MTEDSSQKYVNSAKTADSYLKNIEKEKVLSDAAKEVKRLIE